MQTTLEEICHGLENDLEPQEQLLWQKNLHTLILYALVKKVYKTREQREGIPVLSPLDVLVQVLPKFSCHLYFELVKACSWEQLLISVSIYRISSVIKQSFFPSKTIPKNLDWSYKMDLGLWDCLEGKTCISLLFHRADIVICSLSREWKNPIL